jgi:hypothetical protein
MTEPVERRCGEGSTSDLAMVLKGIRGVLTALKGTYAV